VSHFLSAADLTRERALHLFRVTAELKQRRKAGRHDTALTGRTLALIFEKPSLRTRVTFEVGIVQLGGRAVYLSGQEIGMGTRESVPDVARNLSRWVDGIAARVFTHATVESLARHASIPVINGLSDYEHPCQALADYFTLRERRGGLQGLKLAYVGDGNNVANELMFGAVKLGMRCSIGCPKGYEPNPLIFKSAQREAQKLGSPAPEVTQNAFEAVAGADVVYTDVWTSMGQEAEAAERVRAFQGYGVTPKLMSAAGRDALFMHCLPAHRGEEVAAEVIDGPQSAVFDEAENRLHVQKAVLLTLMGEGSES